MAPPSLNTVHHVNCPVARQPKPDPSFVLEALSEVIIWIMWQEKMYSKTKVQTMTACAQDHNFTLTLTLSLSLSHLRHTHTHMDTLHLDSFGIVLHSLAMYHTGSPNAYYKNIYIYICKTYKRMEHPTSDSWGLCVIWVYCCSTTQQTSNHLICTVGLLCERSSCAFIFDGGTGTAQIPLTKTPILLVTLSVQ